MVDRNYNVFWTISSQTQLKKIFDFISEYSLQNATKVVNDIVASMDKAIDNPEIYNPDKFKINNDGSYRAFEVHHYRITYRFIRSEISVLRVRHTSMEPKKY